MNYGRDKAGFSRRLHRALDKIGAPPRNRGRIDFLRRIYQHHSGDKLSGESLRRWLTGEAIPHTSRLEFLAPALDTSVEWLLTGREQPSTQPTTPIRAEARTQDEDRLIRTYRRLDKVDRSVVLCLVKALAEARDPSKR